MRDVRVEKLAEMLVNYSIGVQPGWKVIIRGSAVGAPAHLTELCVARQVKYMRGVGTARRAFERKAA